MRSATPSRAVHATGDAVNDRFGHREPESHPYPKRHGHHGSDLRCGLRNDQRLRRRQRSDERVIHSEFPGPSSPQDHYPRGAVRR